MKRSLALGAIVALGTLGVLLLRQQLPSTSWKDKSLPPASIRHDTARSKPAATAGAGPTAPVVVPMSAPPGVDAATARAEAYAVIDEAAVTYDERAGAAIAPYLAHADPEIRKMALDGLLRSGEISAAPVLRAATAKLADPREAAAYLDAADYLELPLKKSGRKSTVPVPEHR